jgi:hypothetical protein
MMDRQCQDQGEMGVTREPGVSQWAGRGRLGQWKVCVKGGVHAVQLGGGVLLTTGWSGNGVGIEKLGCPECGG